MGIPLRNVRNKADPCLETSYDYAALYSSSPTNKYILKVSCNSNTRTRYETRSKLTIKATGKRHWLWSGFFIVNFDTLSTERYYRSTGITVNVEHITPPSVSTVTLNKFLGLNFLYFNRFQIKMNEVKYFHEVACTALCLIVFFTGVCKQWFFQRPSINYSGFIVQDKCSWELVPQGISLGVNCLEIAVQGGINKAKMSGSKIQGAIVMWRIS